MKRELLFQLIIALLVLLFTYTAISKLITIEIFKTQLKLSPLYWLRTYSVIVAWLLPLVEIVVVLLLLFPRTKLLGLGISVLLLVSFEIYLGILLLSGKALPCTCGGVIAKMSWHQHWWFNIFFIILSLIGIKYLKHFSYTRVQV